MSREHLFRLFESLPGVFPLVTGLLCILLAVVDTEYTLGTRLLAVFGGLIFTCAGVGTVIAGLRGQHQIIRREPLPGPKVIIDDDGVHFTGEER